MNIKLNKRKKVVIAATTAALLVGGGAAAAFAYWTSLGSGSGSGSTGTSEEFVITADAATGSPLTPGGGSQTIDFTVENPSSGAQYLSSLTVTVANSDGSPWNSGTCDADDFTVGTPTITFGSIDGGDSVDGSVTLSMNNLPTNQDACKSVTVPLYFVAG